MTARQQLRDTTKLQDLLQKLYSKDPNRAVETVVSAMRKVDNGQLLEMVRDQEGMQPAERLVIQAAREALQLWKCSNTNEHRTARYVGLSTLIHPDVTKLGLGRQTMRVLDISREALNQGRDNRIAILQGTPGASWVPPNRCERNQATTTSTLACMLIQYVLAVTCNRKARQSVTMGLIPSLYCPSTSATLPAVYDLIMTFVCHIDN